MLETHSLDTHAYIKSLMGAGFSEQQAEILTKGLRQVHVGNVATKEDLAHVRDELKAEIAALRTETKADLAHVRDELKDDIALLRVEIRDMKAEMLKWAVPVLLGQTAVFAFLVKLL